MRRLSAVLTLLLAALALAVAGCGGSDESEDESATPAEAVAEIDEIKTMLATAVDQVRAGDADAAEETVGDTYLEHFEKVEHRLDLVDLGHGLGGRGRLLLGFVVVAAAAGDGERKGREQEHQHG